MLEKIFGSQDTWVRTTDVSDFLYGSRGEPPRLTEIDHSTAEQMIHRLHGVTGATRL